MAALTRLTLLTLIGIASCLAPECSYENLWNHLNLSSSNTFMTNVRPVKSWNQTTYVAVELLFYGILKVDEKSQTVEGATWTTVSWKNQYLTWTPADFCGIRCITVPRSMIWTPDLHIEEDVSDTSSIQRSPFVNLYFNGYIVTTARQLLTFTCQLDVLMFPFDEQNCTITFSSMSSLANVITLTTLTDGTQLTNATKAVLITQGEWELKNISFTKGISQSGEEIRSQLEYSVNVRRRPMLYVINFIIPLLYFLILDLASFFINQARGEKLSFKVTILLSISVLLLILKDMLPSTEVKMPWIANYCVGIFALVGTSVLEAMGIGFLLSFEENVTDESMTFSNCEDDIQMEKTNSKDPLALLRVSGDLTKTAPPPPSAQMEVGILREILFEIKASREGLCRSKTPKTRPRFKKLAFIIDHVFFVLYFVTVVIFLSIVYDMWVKRYFDI